MKGKSRKIGRAMRQATTESEAKKCREELMRRSQRDPVARAILRTLQ